MGANISISPEAKLAKLEIWASIDNVNNKIPKRIRFFI
jgi:hypothetical protein